VPPLPDGTRLVHIGPPKTGTTALQRAFHACRSAVKEQGVHYAGPTHQPVDAVRAVTGRKNPMTGKVPPMWTWRILAGEIRRAGDGRVVVSSEFFADARPEAIPKIVGDLDVARLHVVVTLRPLARLMPSQWQQNVQAGLRASFDDWLRTVFDSPDVPPATAFWRRQRHDRLISRWADVVGPQNVTAVVLDDRDHAMVLRVFERLVGLREGTLAADNDNTNRSLTLAEVEVVRAFNQLSVAEGIGTPLHSKVMRYGAGQYMKLREPGNDEQRIQMPQWAFERANEVAREMVAGISGSGVRVIGDLDNLTAVPTAGRSVEVETVVIPPDIAARAAVGVVLASGLARGGTGRIPLDHELDEGAVSDPNAYIPSPAIEPLPLVRLSTAQVALVLIRRMRSRVLGLAHPIRRRLP
jgi:hypothetical protein